eukprot:3425916-Amphidinium_carterae.1
MPCGHHCDHCTAGAGDRQRVYSWSVQPKTVGVCLVLRHADLQIPAREAFLEVQQHDGTFSIHVVASA